jgi:hypothetical protein
MTFYNSKFNWMRKFRYFPTLMLIALLLPVSSCQTVEKTTKSLERTGRKVVRPFTMADRDLKRMVGLFDFQNKSLRESRDFQKVFRKGLPEYMARECEDIIISTADSDSGFGLLGKPPRMDSGQIDNFALAVVGRRLGLNAIVVGVLENIRILDELRGILWAKDTTHLVQVFIRVQVFDSATATKILDQTFDRRIEIDELEYDLINNSRAIKLPELSETLHKLLVDIGDNICWAVESLPWIGFLTHIDGEQFIISSGIAVGLQVGDVLTVYDSSKIINGVGGQRFFLPGLKTGEIKIVTISENSAQAERVSGENIQAGSTVRRK